MLNCWAPSSSEVLDGNLWVFGVHSAMERTENLGFEGLSRVLGSLGAMHVCGLPKCSTHGGVSKYLQLIMPLDLHLCVLSTR